MDGIDPESTPFPTNTHVVDIPAPSQEKKTLQQKLNASVYTNANATYLPAQHR